MLDIVLQNAIESMSHQVIDNDEVVTYPNFYSNLFNRWLHGFLFSTPQTSKSDDAMDSSS